MRRARARATPRRARAKEREHLVHAGHLRDVDPRDRRRARGHEGAPEPHRLRLLEPRVHPRRGLHLPAQAHLPDDDGIRIDGDALLEAEDRRRDREIDPRVLHREAADDVHVDVAPAERTCKVRLDDPDQQLDAPRVEAARPAARRRAILPDEQRLHLDAERAAALDDRRDDRARPLRALREEEPRRVLDLREAVRAHLEEPDLVRRAEPVLHRPQRAQRRVAVPLEEEHGIDGVLKEARAGEPALLRHLPDEHERGPRGARGRHEHVRGAPHLRRTPRRPLHAGRPERLHAVHDAERGPVRGDQRGQLLRIRRLDDEERARVEPHPRGP